MAIFHLYQILDVCVQIVQQFWFALQPQALWRQYLVLNNMTERRQFLYAVQNTLIRTAVVDQKSILHESNVLQIQFRIKL